MAVFKQIASQFASKSIQRLLHQEARVRVAKNIASAKSILIIFDGQSAQMQSQFEAYQLTKKGKEMGAFFLAPKESSGPNAYTSKETIGLIYLSWRLFKNANRSMQIC